MKKLNSKFIYLSILFFGIFYLSSCSTTYYEYKNICTLNYNRNNGNIPINFQVNDSSLLVVTNFKTKKKESISFKVFELIDNVVTNQQFFKNYDKIISDFRRYKQDILDENGSNNSVYRKNIFYKQQVKSFGKKIADKGLSSKYYKRNIPFSSSGKMKESDFPDNMTNYKIVLENVTSCLFDNDSINLTQLPKPRKIQWSNVSYNKKVKLLIYKVSVKDKEFNYFSHLKKSIDINDSIEKTFYFAISQYQFGSAGGDHYYSVFFLSPQFINYKYTIKNLSRSFVNFNTNDPFSYIPYIKMYLCDKYSKTIIESSCENTITPTLLKYLETKNKSHYYAFYSEIYKKDMLLRLNTKHPEKIKVTTYKP